MTTGHILVNNQHPWINPANGLPNGTVGKYEEKIWNGADSPPRGRATGMRQLIRRWVPDGTNRDGTIRWRYKPSWVPTGERRKPRRSLQEHPYTMSYFKSHDEEVFWRQVHPSGPPDNWVFRPLTQYGLQTTGTLRDKQGRPVTDFTISGNDFNKLVNDLAEKVRGTSFNPAISFYEAFESLDMIRKNVTTLARAIRALKTGNTLLAWRYLVYGTERRNLPPPAPNKKVRYVDPITGKWLEMRLGWMPLLQDIKTAAEYAASFMNEPATKRVKVQIGKGGSSAGPETGIITNPRRKFAVRSLIAIFKETLDSNLSFSLKHPELLLWEALPYSFVLDYVLPVGDWLQARANASSMNALFVDTLFQKDTIGPVGNGYPTTVNGGNFYEFSAFLYKYQIVSVDRQVYTTLKIPSPEFKPLAKAATVIHCLNSFALLSQAIKR
jgi:hypothetical protein